MRFGFDIVERNKFESGFKVIYSKMYKPITRRARNNFFALSEKN